MNDIRDERLRRAWQRPDDRDGTHDGCPDDATLWAAAHGEPDAEAVRTVLAHVATCDACDESFRMARELQPPAPVRRTALPYWAAAVAAAVLLAVWWWPANDAVVIPESDSTLRAPVASGIEAVVADDAALPRERFALAWTGTPDGATAVVTLADDDLDVVWRGETGSRSVVVPATALEDLAAGTALWWRVDTRLADGREVRSPLFRVRVE